MRAACTNLAKLTLSAARMSLPAGLFGRRLVGPGYQVEVMDCRTQDSLSMTMRGTVPHTGLRVSDVGRCKAGAR